MQQYSVDQLKKFVDHLTTYSGAWRSIDLRIASTKIAGKEICLILDGRFEELPPDQLPPTPPDPSVGNFKAERIILPFDQLGKLLKDVVSEKLEVDGRSILLGKLNQDGTVREGLGLNTTFSEGGRARWGNFEQSAVIRLLQYNQTINEASANTLNESDLELAWKSLNAPYRDTEDVLGEYFRRPTTLMDQTKSYFLLEARVPVEFTDATGWTDGRLTVEVSIGGYLDPDLVTVGLVMIPRTGRKHRESFAWKSGDWKQNSTKHVATWARDDQDILGCEVYLRYDGSNVGSRELINRQAQTSNIAMNAHRHFDPHFEHYERWIAGQGPKPAREFERAVAWLFHFCGLRTAFYGTGQDFDNEIDQLGYWDEGKVVLAVECTTHSKDLTPKMKNVIRRCANLERAAAGWEVMPVVATCLEPKEITDTERQMAGTDKVVLLTAKQLKEIFQMAERCCPPGDVVDFLSKGGSAKPPAPQYQLPGMLGIAPSFRRTRR